MGYSDRVIASRHRGMCQFFSWMFTRQLRRNFGAVHLLNPPQNQFENAERGRIFFMNHPSWNDPMLGAFLHYRFFPDLEPYAPIDSVALEAYPFMKRIGLFGVTRGDQESARQFLRTCQGILERPQSALWVTPQGRFADARERPVRIEPGLGVLLKIIKKPVMVNPVAVEYVFGEEKRAEIFVSFGERVLEPLENTSSGWKKACEKALEKTQDELAARVVAREWGEFTTILGGNAGVGGIYETWQRCKALLAGKKFDPSHSSLTRK